MNVNTHSKLIKQIHQSKSILCIGLDPRINITNSNEIFAKITEHNKRIIDETADQCACYKPNIAFYEQWGIEGWKSLEWTLDYIPSSIPVILDAKRGDIGATAEAYAYAAFEQLKVDSITLAPYMGTTSIEPFLEYKQKLLFVLARTSNPNAEDVQEKIVHGNAYSRYMYLEIVEQFSSLSENIGFVVAANCYDALETIRSLHPNLWILAPGIGTQGGDIQKAVRAGIAKDGLGLLPVVARGVSNAKSPAKACKQYNELITQALDAEFSSPSKKQIAKSTLSATLNIKDQHSARLQQITAKLFEYQCIKIGNFVLKSGLNSPFYIDLRRVISFPDLFALVTDAYCQIIEPLQYDYIAGIPTAALPFAAAVAQTLQVPMIYPRIPKKPHGSGNQIEGAYEAGKKALLLDDLITKGSSKIEALEILHDAKLYTSDIAVLICRSNKAIEDMQKLGISLHYTLHIDSIIQYGIAHAHINKEEALRIQEFLQS